MFSWQAIRDGVIDATIDHEKGHVQSKVRCIHLLRIKLVTFNSPLYLCIFQRSYFVIYKLLPRRPTTIGVYF